MKITREGQGAGEMVRWVKELAPELSDQSSISRPTWKNADFNIVELHCVKVCLFIQLLILHLQRAEYWQGLGMVISVAHYSLIFCKYSVLLTS